MQLQALRAGSLITGFLVSPAVLAEWTVNMTPGVTGVSHDIYNLHMIIFWICVVIAIVVFGVMFWSILAHRKSKGHKPAHFHEHTLVEILWTVIPLLILVGMCIPATATLLDMYDTKKADLNIKITGYQWKWQYTYMDEDFSFFANIATPQDEIQNRQKKNDNYLLEVDNPLVLPIHKKVRFLVTSNDVIHSWWVPALAVKKDAIPGYINETWTNIDEPGIYRGQCAELCGKGHGFMPIVVKAVSEDEYKSWAKKQIAAAEKERELTSKDWTLDELMARGEKAYNTNCSACHQSDGSGAPPTFPALKGNEITTKHMDQHIETVVNGRSGTAMQAFGKQLSEVDIAAIITYERNAWGNDTGEKVTPKQILDFKNTQ